MNKLCAISLLLLPFFSFLNANCEEIDDKNPPKTSLQQALESCYLEEISKSDNTRTVAEIIDFCQKKLKIQRDVQIGRQIDNKLDSKEILSPLQKRLRNEWKARDNPDVFTGHKPNYLLPVTYSKKPNDDVLDGILGDQGLDKLEAKFQLSFKVPILYSLLGKDALFFGFTLQSYWQVYNSEVSAPFRETNYQPELFYGFTNDLKLGDWTNSVNFIGIEHQSNGRAQPLSRSWNRIYFQTFWENNHWLVSLKPWYRLPEQEKQDPNEADGDDNPDIEKFMGHFEFSANYKVADQSFGILLRNNLRSDNRGAVQLDWSFPMGSRFKGYLQYFNGYGESLIDYNYSIERVGLGVLLTDVF